MIVIMMVYTMLYCYAIHQHTLMIPSSYFVYTMVYIPKVVYTTFGVVYAMSPGNLPDASALA
jgi:hypothetical protein